MVRYSLNEELFRVSRGIVLSAVRGTRLFNLINEPNIHLVILEVNRHTL